MIQEMEAEWLLNEYASEPAPPASLAEVTVTRAIRFRAVIAVAVLAVPVSFALLVVTVVAAVVLLG